MAIVYFDGERGRPGTLVAGTDSAGNTRRFVVPAFMPVGADGLTPIAGGTAADPQYTQSAALPAGTDRSGSAGVAATTLAALNTARRGLNIQNISANVLWINETGGTAAIATAGSYQVASGATINVRTNRAVSVIASAASSAYTATEW